MEKFDAEITKDPVHTVKQKEEHEQKQKLVGNLKPHRGHTIYKYNVTSGELTKAVFEEQPADFVKAKKGSPQRKKIIVEKGCVYLSALNVKNAMRKVARYYGVDLKVNK